MPILKQREFTYDINESSLTAILIEADTASAKIEIPPKVDKYTVVAIHRNVFIGNPFIKTVLLPDTITCIYQSAFMNSSIKNFKIYKSGVDSYLTGETLKIKSSAFKDCKNLEYVELKDSTELTEVNIFQNCPKLHTITAEYIQDTIPRYSFANCTNLANFTIKKPITIDRLAFKDAKISVLNNMGYVHSYGEDFLEALKNAQINTYGDQFADLAYEGYNVVMK